MRLIKRQRKTVAKIVHAGSITVEEWAKVDESVRYALVKHRLVNETAGQDKNVVPTKRAKALVQEWGM